MHLYISEFFFRKNRVEQTFKNPLKYKLYNLLFTGRISMKEYLAALQNVKPESKNEE